MDVSEPPTSHADPQNHAGPENHAGPGNPADPTRPTDPKNLGPTTPPARTSLWRLPAMVLLALYTLAGFTGFFVTMASLPAWLAATGTPAGLAGQVTTVLLVATVSTQMLVPRIVQRIGLGPTLAVGMVALGVPSLLFLVSTDLGWVMAMCALRGIGFGIMTVLGSTLTARIVPVERRGEAIGIYGLAIALPNLIAIPAGVALVTAGHFAPVAIMGGAPLLGLLAVPALAHSVRDDSDRSPRGSARPSEAEIAAKRAARRTAQLATVAPAVVLMVVTMAGGGFLTYLPIERPDGALAAVGLLVWGMTGALARWRVGVLADRSGLRALLPGSSILAIVGMSTVVAGLFLGTGSAGWVVTIFGAAVLGIGYGAVQSLTLVAAFARSLQRETATVSAIWNVGFDSGTALGAGVVGALTAVVGVPIALAATVLFILASMPLAIRSSRPPTDDEVPDDEVPDDEVPATP